MDLLKLIFSGENITSKAVNGGMLLLRVFAGLALAFGHGIKKFPPSERFIEGVGNMGFPMPGFFAWSASISEMIGGLLLAVGLATRPSAFFITITVLVAAFIRHADDPFSSKEKGLLFAFIGILYVCAGAGKYSLDALIRKNNAN